MVKKNTMNFIIIYIVSALIVGSFAWATRKEEITKNSDLVTAIFFTIVPVMNTYAGLMVVGTQMIAATKSKWLDKPVNWK